MSHKNLSISLFLHFTTSHFIRDIMKPIDKNIVNTAEIVDKSWLCERVVYAQTCLIFHFSKFCCISNDYALQYVFFSFLFSLLSCICCKLSTTATPGLGFCLLLLTNCAPVRSCVVRGVVAPGPALSLPIACDSPFLRSTSTPSSTTGWLRLPFAPLCHNTFYTLCLFACTAALVSR